MAISIVTESHFVSPRVSVPSVSNQPDSRSTAARQHLAIIGTGYVGLTTGVCMAHLGHRVIGYDTDTKKIAALSAGQQPLYEEGLTELFNEVSQGNLLSFTTDVREAAQQASIVFLCVATPQGEDGSADLSFLRAACREISPHLRSGTVIVIKSTVPVGSASLVKEQIGRDDIRVVSNPEFLREGSAVYDCLHPDRVVIGADDVDAANLVASLYDGIETNIIRTDSPSAEAIKYVANAYLATRLTFVNSVAALCEAVGADISAVIDGLGADQRIGRNHLTPGPGWGGSCFPKDTRALIRLSESNGFDFGLLRAAILENEVQFDRVADKVRELAGGDLIGKKVAVLGLTFKAGTDDVRDSPAINVSKRLQSLGANIVAFDPQVDNHKSGVPAEFELADSPITACMNANVIAVLTEWDEFRTLSPAEVKAVVNNPNILDGRNMLDAASWTAAGFRYAGVGR